MNDPVLDPSYETPDETPRQGFDPKTGEIEEGCCTAPPDTDPGPPG